MKLTPLSLFLSFVGALAVGMAVSGARGVFTSPFKSAPPATEDIASATNCIQYDRDGKRIGPCSPSAPAANECIRVGLDGNILSRGPGPCEPTRERIQINLNGDVIGREVSK